MNGGYLHAWCVQMFVRCCAERRGTELPHIVTSVQHRQESEHMPASLWHSKFIASGASLSVQWSVQQCVGSLEDSWISAQV